MVIRGQTKYEAINLTMNYYTDTSHGHGWLTVRCIVYIFIHSIQYIGTIYYINMLTQE